MTRLLPTLVLLSILAACAGPETMAGFDRPGLLERAPADRSADLQRAERHILVVRHARKISSDCNALDCPLSPQGEAMVARLAELIGTPAVDQAYASAACRTLRTAEAGGQAVIVHQAGDGMEAGCAAQDVITRNRATAFADAAASDARWTLVGEHSNTSCLWLAQFAGPEASQAVGCSDGRLADHAYGDIFWLYQLDGGWQVTVLPSAFEVDAQD
ncbi:histidine phosphatase family protein [Maricaulis salignorans]|uniref:Histidine phosphatase superfamily (Branch 1) n=1 Tax=Maricaulis salignorans TaxID=144026 RepID=A0A1G9R0V2_9PROT|nr:histidine phosphatase family protein [Maricaulis salignorans]SDM16761.1 Histidine phosphatase superfamily (branch 1) [Maricaulis salignorans]